MDLQHLKEFDTCQGSSDLPEKKLNREDFQFPEERD